MRVLLKRFTGFVMIYKISKVGGVLINKKAQAWQFESKQLELDHNVTGGHDTDKILVYCSDGDLNKGPLNYWIGLNNLNNELEQHTTTPCVELKLKASSNILFTTVKEDPHHSKRSHHLYHVQSGQMFALHMLCRPIPPPPTLGRNPTQGVVLCCYFCVL